MSTPKIGTSASVPGRSWSLVVTMRSPGGPSADAWLTSHPHPLPLIPSRAAVKEAWKVSKLPQVAAIRADNLGADVILASALDAGVSDSQKRAWLRCPPPLNLTTSCSEICEATSWPSMAADG